MRTSLSLALLLAFTPACDSPDDEEALQALDAEAELQAAEDLQGSPASLALDVITSDPQPVAAQPNQLCRTNSGAILYTSPTSGIYVPPNALVRILDYAGPYHYLARYDGTVGQLERSRINQSSCYYQ
ncbi:MAG TPA: hypothetical protein VGB85_34270 [Nannocystis sp.]